VDDTPRAGDGHGRIPVLDLERLRAWLTTGDVDHERLAVVSVELDNLAAVRARLGHDASMQLLDAITQRLRSLTRPRDVVAHVNQERFVLVCRDIPDAAAGQRLAERIAMGVSHPSVVPDGVAEVTASIGVALPGVGDDRPEAVLRRAIKAGNRARANGGDGIQVATGGRGVVVHEVDIAAALAHQQFRVHYLPVVSCATGRVAGFEALVRWEHPEHGLLRAASFFDVAERNGLAVPIGDFVLEQACAQLAAWHVGTPALKLDLNLSPSQLADPQLALTVERVVDEHGLDPAALWVEVSEGTLLADRHHVGRVLQRLHDLGAGVVIDDFGTASGSLASLSQHPVDAVKIAPSFVTDLGRDRDGDAVCGAIVDLAHSIGLSVVAEGVATLEQFAALRVMGCEHAQGRLFGGDHPAEHFGPSPASAVGLLRAPEAP
jgi:diguanylate cyclase (GGDEF)-like protein